MHLTAKQIRAAMRLTHECYELGGDCVAWREHMLHGLIRLLGADVAYGGVAYWGDWLKRKTTSAEVHRVFSDVGWPNQRERQAYLDWVAHGVPFDNPMCKEIGRRRTTRLVATRPELVDTRTWRRAPLIDRLRNEAKVDEAITSAESFAAGKLLLIALQRARGRRPFADRERETLRIIHEEVIAQLGRRLALFGEPSARDLPKRLREVLASLLEGDSEKQVALRLRLSRHTIHEHVKRLYRHFGVSSRGELHHRCAKMITALRREGKPAQ
jgi:DNA-binding CsgD family transcriptional regulator